MGSERLFGTDGVRGIPGKHPLVSDVVRAIGEIAARVMLERGVVSGNGHGPFVLIGRDTRGSGPELMKQLVRGFAAAGVRSVDLGVIPTPGVSYLTPRLGALCGVVISASHNPAEFNGIKFFDQLGFKMDPPTEDLIQQRLESGWLRTAPAPRVSPKGLEDGAKHAERYVEFLRSTFPATLDLTGMKLVVDCANGASAAYAKGLFESLGADVVALSCAPNGKNINAGCGALFPEQMQKEVVRRKADAGVCFDGDADRAIVCDEKGALLDGDAIICLGALRLRGLGLLRGDKVVLTVMSNFGFLKFLEEQGIGVVTVPVGDRNVTEAIERERLSLGGESSGHIIFRRYAATGDGMLTALQTLAALRESGKPLSTHRKSFHPYPQVLQNLEVTAKPKLETLPKLNALIKGFEKELSGNGRILVRYSGTEPLLRIMIEGPTQARIKEMARAIADDFLKETGQEAHA